MASGSVAAVTRSRRHDACLVGKNQFSRSTGAQPSGVEGSGKFRSTVECRSTIRYDISALFRMYVYFIIAKMAK